MRKVIIVAIIILLVLVSGCSSSITAEQPVNSVSPSETIKEVMPSQELIKQAIDDCQNQESWGINPPVMNVSFSPGVKYIGCLVLHNGLGQEAIITVSYKPTKTVIVDTANKLTYGITPDFMNESCINIETKSVRLKTMQTEMIPISLFVPEKTEMKYERWSFYINADAQFLSDSEQEFEVTTEPNDNGIGVFRLKGNTLAVKSIVSEIPEELTIINYDNSNKTLTVSGFQPNLKRKVTVKIEVGSMITQGYDQIWLLKAP